MTERPVLFKGPMVLRVLDDSKTHTRRVPTSANTLVDGKRVSPKAWQAIDFDWRRAQCVEGPCILVPEKRKRRRLRLSPVWEVGDHLWVRETWSPVSYSALPEYPDEFSAFAWHEDRYGPLEAGARDLLLCYRADGEDKNPPELYPCIGGGKVLRDAEIRWRPSIFMFRWASRIDLAVLSMRAERVQEISVLDCIREGIAHDAGETELMMIEATGDGDDRHKETFADLWDSINAPRGWGWDTNRPVWVAGFKRIKP